jgi:hypothetical protein
MLISCSTKPGDFTVKAPYGWTVSDSISASGGRTVHMHPPIYSEIPIFVNNIIISIVHFPSLYIYRTATLKSVKSDAVYFEEKGKGEKLINGYEMEWEHHIIKYKKSERTLEQKVYFVWDKGNIYQIVCTTEKNEMEIFQFRIDEVLNSFRILK